MWNVDFAKNNECFSVFEIVDRKEFFHNMFFELVCEKVNFLIIDCGNRFDPYRIVRKAKYARIDYKNILKGINITRMFTVHQLMNTIENIRDSEFDVVVVYDMDVMLLDDSYNKEEIQNVVKHGFEVVKNMNTPIVFNLEDSFFIKKKDINNFRLVNEFRNTVKG